MSPAPNAVFDAVNLGYMAVVPSDAIAGGARRLHPRDDPSHARPRRHRHHHAGRAGLLAEPPESQVLTYEASVMVSPSTLIDAAGSGSVAGPADTLPVAASNLLP